MEIWQIMKKNRFIVIVAVLVILILLTSIVLFYSEKTDPSELIEGIDEQEIIIEEQLRELEEIREERRGEEEYIPPMDEEIQRQIDELDSIRR